MFNVLFEAFGKSAVGVCSSSRRGRVGRVREFLAPPLDFYRLSDSVGAPPRLRMPSNLIFFLILSLVSSYFEFKSLSPLFFSIFPFLLFFSFF